MSNDRWTRDEYKHFLATGQEPRRGDVARPNRAAVSVADLERNPVHAVQAADHGQEVHTRFRCHVHSKRRRLTDGKGVYDKAAIDGITRGGIWPDDGPRYVEAYSESQEKTVLNEETIIEVWEVE